jgi:DNA-binding response OmpR family regulator
MQPAPTAQPRIAVVDDDASTRQMLDDLLAEEGFAVARWSGVDDPVAFVQAATPDLVILDLHLGGDFQAWDVIDALCGDGSAAKVPVIVCSADGITLKRDTPAFRDRGCVIVEKPFDLDDLLRAIHGLLTVTSHHH